MASVGGTLGGAPVTTVLDEKTKMRHDLPPSKVIHCRAVAQPTKETDLVEAMNMFGNIKALKLMPKISQALVEFEKLESAIACVTYCAKQPIVLYGRLMYANYSKSTEINRKFATNKDASSPTNILLFTVLNVIHPVNVTTLKTICQQQNVEVQRAVIFHKNGLQALIEFKTTDDAAQILLALNGCDIYPGCCTLKIEYSNCSQLNVWQNDEESYSIDCVNNGSNHGNMYGSNNRNNRYGDWDAKPIESTNSYSSGYTYLGNSEQGGEGCVAMVYNINNGKMNCEHLFNLFCLYGNVVKVKILTGKDGIAMVQFGNRICTDMAMQYLNHTLIHGKQIQVSPSKHSFIADPIDTTPLFDGSPPMRSYLKDRNNRFSPGGKNDPYSRVHPPSKVLHYFNAPPDLSEERITELFQSYHVEVPLKQACIARAGARSSSGLLEFTSNASAAEALVAVNHATLHKMPEDPSNGKPGAPYTFKLEFSLSSTINK